MIPSRKSIVFAALLLLPFSAQAFPHTAVVVQGGTLGIGGALYLGLPHSTDVRFGAGYFSLSHAFTSGNIHYDGHARIENFSLLGA